jgi:ubiquinone biosynthesis protein
MGKKYDEHKRAAEIISVLKKHEVMRHGITPEKLRLILQDLGPTFVKLGQVMSMRTDMLPQKYCEELEKLRTEVTPMPVEDVYTVIQEECGCPVDEIFSSFDEKPLGSACIAQTHAAVLSDGQRVAVKVQRMGIRETMEKDNRLLKKAAKLMKLTPIEGTIDINMVLDEMWTVSLQELDFHVEARNAKEFYENNSKEKGISSPQIIESLSTSRMLVMEYIDGFSIGDINNLNSQGIDKYKLCTRFVDNYIKQVIDDGFFHADPHPGNIRIRDGEIVWIDMGMMGRLTEKDRKLFKKAIHAVTQKDINEIINVLMTLGVCREPIKHSRLYEDVDSMMVKYSTIGTGDIDIAVFLEELFNLASSHGIAMPSGVSMLARGMMTAEGILAAVCPEVNVVEVAAAHLKKEYLSEIDIKKEIESSIYTLMKSGSKSLAIPSLASDLMEAVIKGHAKINLEIMGAGDTMGVVEKLVNRVIICIIASSLFIGSSLIFIAGIEPKLFGVPVLGIIGFIAAILLTLWMVLAIRRRKK